MKTLKKLFGIKTQEEKDREKEMDYRMRMARARREAAALQRKLERSKAKAIELERNGEHDKAVTLALQAERDQKAFKTAESQLAKCTDIHEMAQGQKILTSVMRTCRELSDGIIEIADVEGAIAVQEENEAALARLMETEEQMKLFSEGLENGMDAEIRSAAGESALASILAEENRIRMMEKREPAEQEVSAVDVKSVAAADPEKDTWIRSRRENLKALAADA